MADEKNNERTGWQPRRKNNRLNVRIADTELEMLNTISFEEEEPVSQIVRKAIRTYDALRKNKPTF